jgi:ATP-dependent RNA helicase DeaD
VVALSGELSQGERSHALMALRDGRARVCVATDVAARGIDLPGLELVVHFDLPSNSEVLLHRSGRTGRAGAKGTSVLIVTPAEYRKAQRLLHGAKVAADWGKPPSAEEVQASDDARLLADPAFAAPEDEIAAMADALLAAHGPAAVAAAAVRLWRAGRSAPEVLGDIAPPAPAERAAVTARATARTEFGPSVWFSLSVGRADRAEARWLLPKLCDAGGITKDAIGAIRVQDDETFVQIATAQTGRFTEGQEIGPGLVLTRIEGEPDTGRPPRRDAARPPRPREGAAAEGRPRTAPTRDHAPRYRGDAGADTTTPHRPYAAKTARPGPAARPARADADAAASPREDATALRKPRWSKDDTRRGQRADHAAPARPPSTERPRPAEADRTPRPPKPAASHGRGDAERRSDLAGAPKPARGKSGPRDAPRAGKPAPKYSPRASASAQPATDTGPRGGAQKPRRPTPPKPDLSDPGVSLRPRGSRTAPGARSGKPQKGKGPGGTKPPRR